MENLESNQQSNDEEAVFDIQTILLEDEERYISNKFIKDLMEDSGIKITHERSVERAYQQNSELGLFYLFLHSSFFECIRNWSKKEIEQKAISEEEFKAYLGLELASSINKTNNLKGYWSTQMFLWNLDFSKVMPRDRFLNIRSSLKFNPFYDSEPASKDPLWHSRAILNHLAFNCANVAVPLGAVSLYENTVRSSARCSAITYIKNKPVKFGRRFYIAADWKHIYIHSMTKNGSGNKTKIPRSVYYCSQFRSLRNMLENKLDHNVISRDSPSAIWIIQLAHQSQCYRYNKGRLVLTDNFYTRHTMATQLSKVTDGEYNMLGAVRLNLVDGINRINIKEAQKILSDMERGSWVLSQASHMVCGENIADNAGYVVCKDKNIVTFYSNAMAKTPKDPVDDASAHAIECVHGIKLLYRWTGVESINRSEFNVCVSLNDC